MTIANGNVTGFGGGIFNQAPLQVASSLISGNRASFGGGGVGPGATRMATQIETYMQSLTQKSGQWCHASSGVSRPNRKGC